MNCDSNVNQRKPHSCLCVYLCVILADITPMSRTCTENTTMATPLTPTVAMATVTVTAGGRPDDGCFLPRPQVTGDLALLPAACENT